MRISEILFENLETWDTGRWVHYSDHPMMTINLKSYFQDPLAIYMFPESFKPQTMMWPNMENKFTVTIKSTAKILDWSSLTDDQIEQFLHACKAWDHYQETMARYPDTDRARILHRVWESMRSSMILGEGGGKARWNKVFREAGWDAIFDDTGAIHTSEVQLLVLDPRVIATVHKASRKTGGFVPMQKVVKELIDLCSPYGDVEVDGPKRMRDGYSSSAPTKLMTKIHVKRSDENYLDMNVRFDPDDKHRKCMINVSVNWARPSLNAGYGAEYNFIKDAWDNYSGISDIKRALDKTFTRETVEESQKDARPFVIDDGLLRIAQAETAASKNTYEMEMDAQGTIIGSARMLDKAIKRGDFSLADISNDWSKSREYIRSKYGNEVILHRADAPSNEHSNDTLTVYFGDKKLASRFNSETRTAKSYVVRTDDIVAVYARKSGYWEIIAKKPSGGLTYRQ